MEKRQVDLPNPPGEIPFGHPVLGWRTAPDCGRCNDTGRYQEQHGRITVDAHCTCKKGRRMSELWIADKFADDVEEADR
ncbi:hypothetical protein QFW96_14480 [Saccharopolyspora sp. TS4A08]|uniref:Uncharacterized protein n=1 Tax=Saccharopolyspora ipomoeae TaxID=3042027 RepID=A0ABT6PP95_9PSEU|nr:hypothetical protein [Saccharopolyspora sp. TS4A08]MDI2029834.1 hypothetical protein [Saccharopolyspora sp. TS4A08]